MEPISSGPVTSDLPLGACGAERRSPRVVTACVLLTSHWSPPLSLQNTMPPTSATLFSASLGKFGNSLSSRPRHHWWDTIMSLSSWPEACSVGCFDGPKPQLGRKFMPHYRKWAVYSPHHKHGGRCFNSNISSWCDFYCKNLKKICNKASGALLQLSCS